MEVMAECRAGLDVHQATAAACLNSGLPGEKSGKTVRTSGTTHHELIEMRDRLNMKASAAIARKILAVARQMLADGTEHQELGGGYPDNPRQANTSNRLVERLKAMGFNAALTPMAT